MIVFPLNSHITLNLSKTLIFLCCAMVNYAFLLNPFSITFIMYSLLYSTCKCKFNEHLLCTDYEPFIKMNIILSQPHKIYLENMIYPFSLPFMSWTGFSHTSIYIIELSHDNLSVNAIYKNKKCSWEFCMLYKTINPWCEVS